MGFPPERADVTLETTQLAGVVANERADLTIAVRAGTPLRDVVTLLAAQGQFVPFDAPQPHYATIGGTLAAGWLGPRRHLYGRVRDYVIGSTIVLADGTIARAGGMVVKNVAGYDMSRLYVGSFGTLGVLVQANFKTAPLPQHARLFLAPLPERTRERACAQLATMALRPAAAFWVVGFTNAIDGEDGPEGRIVVLVEGSDALLERATRDLRSALGRAGRSRDARRRRGRTRGVRARRGRVCRLPRRTLAHVSALPPAARSERCALRPAGARGALRPPRREHRRRDERRRRVARQRSRCTHAGREDRKLRRRAARAEPRAQVVAGKHSHRPYLRVWGEAPAAIEQMRALKLRFDPNRTLNPGRFVGGI